MNSFERQAFLPPPPSPFTVLGRYGKAGKLKVWVYGQARIMTVEQAIKFARSTKAAGGAVDLAGLIDPKRVEA